MECLKPALHAQPASTDLGDPKPSRVAQPSDRVAQRLPQCCFPTPLLSTDTQRPPPGAGLQSPQSLLWNGKLQYLLLGSVALVLDDQQGTVRIGLVLHRVDPVGQGVVAEGQATMLVGLDLLSVLRPDRHQHGRAAQEQRVRPMVDVLAAEVPDPQMRLDISR